MMHCQIALFALVTVLGGCLRGAEPVYFGVSGPLTGPNSQYGAQWKKGFDLALEQINSRGGVRGLPLQYIFEDSQSDPRQSIAVAAEICE